MRSYAPYRNRRSKTMPRFGGLFLLFLGFYFLGFLPFWPAALFGILALVNLNKDKGGCGLHSSHRYLPAADEQSELSDIFEQPERRARPRWREKDLV